MSYSCIAGSSSTLPLIGHARSMNARLPGVIVPSGSRLLTSRMRRTPQTRGAESFPMTQRAAMAFTLSWE
jgi:hypothetical protein